MHNTSSRSPSLSGSLEKPQITLSPGPEVNWGDKVEITCTVATEHLGGTFILRKTQESVKLEKFSEHEATTFTFPKVDFNHTGSYFCEYHKKLPNQVIFYPQGETADLSVTGQYCPVELRLQPGVVLTTHPYCAVKLEKPSISLTSPQAMVIYSPDKVAVTQGSSFSIICSTHSTYPGGVFHLMTSDKQVSETRAAFTHFIFNQANFDFPTIGYEHQGEYSCVYSINISSSPFCSAPSKTLQVTVAGKSHFCNTCSFCSYAHSTSWSFYLWRSPVVLRCRRSCWRSCGPAVCAGCRLPGLEKVVARCR